MTDCKTITFRPTPESERAISQLMEAWGCKRSEAVNRAIVVALNAKAMVPRGTASVTVAPQKVPVVVHGVVDPEKLAAFQRKAGMTVYDARKRK